MPRTPALLALLLLTACSGSAAPARPAPLAEPSVAAGPVGRATLLGALLAPGDLPGTVRPYAAASLVDRGDPRLSLCRPVVADAPHEVANVFISPPRPGQAVVFEVLGAYATPAAAQVAWARARAAAQSCPSYDSSGSPVTLADLGPVSATAFHYRLRTPAVVTGDARTVAVQGSWTVTVSGYGKPADGSDLLAYQARVLTKALARLPKG